MRRDLLASVHGAPLMVQAVMLHVLLLADDGGEALGLMSGCTKRLGLSRAEVLRSLVELEERGVCVTRVEVMRGKERMVVSLLDGDA